MIEGCLGIHEVLQRSTGDVIAWRMKELDNKKKEYWVKTMTISSQSGFKNLCPYGNINRKVMLYMNELPEFTKKFAVYDPKTGIFESYIP